MSGRKCSAVHHSTGRMYRDALTDTCQNAATVERNGRPYCNRHDPEAKEARAEAKRIAALPVEAARAAGDAAFHAKRAARFYRESGNAAKAQAFDALVAEIDKAARHA